MTLSAGAVTDASALPVTHVPVPGAQVLAGAPTTGLVELTESIGVWEHTPGTSTDVEADEVFVVLSGAATVRFVEPSLPAIELRPGSIVRLDAGMRTQWSVHATLRKVYIAG
ncbi:cupin domain-containing protein [Microbacterium yannicii]|uniref:cupin domain-containing protein n=1 Tax=Microbacterium yannicii TaxID=671622 RepID=UPI00030D9102|nr:cupin domain-containing protein [Microbacterium yannicii]